jgi:2'-5' RNA ligase
MDVADAAASDGVMIAFLPVSSDWCNIDIPHMTLVYAGLKSDMPPLEYNEFAKDAGSLALLANPFSLMVRGVKRFGPPEDQVNGLSFQATPDLWAMRRYVEKWNKSSFPFDPHATIGPVQSFVENVPRSVMFDRVFVGYGDENITFNMRRGGY